MPVADLGELMDLLGDEYDIEKMAMADMEGGRRHFGMFFSLRSFPITDTCCILCLGDPEQKDCEGKTYKDLILVYASGAMQRHTSQVRRRT
jgi:hypothetical protein